MQSNEDAEATEVTLPPQRWYQAEAHRHGKGRWERRGPVHESKHQAHAWAVGQGWLPHGHAENGSRDMVYRVIEVKVQVA